MKKSRWELQNLFRSKLNIITDYERTLLKWVEIVIAAVCLVVLIYLVFFSPPDTQNRLDYSILVAVEFLIMIAALFLNLQKKMFSQRSY